LFGTFLSTFLLPALGWRWIFFAMVPLGLVGIWGASELRKIDHERYPARLDWAGSLLLFLALATLSLSFHHLHAGGESFDEGWTYHLSMHVLTLLLLGALLVVEWRSPAPLIQFRVFSNGAFSFAILANGICHGAMMGSSFLIPFLIERGLGMDARHTGTILMAMALMMTVSSLFGGWLHDRFHSPLLAPSAMGLIACGLVGMGLFATVLSYGQFTAILVVLGTAMGVFITVNNVQIISVLPNAMRGLASGMEQSSRQLGHALGITATAVAMASRLPQEILPSVPPEAYVAGFQRAVLLMGAMAFLGTIFSLVRGARVSLQLSGAPVPAPLPITEASMD
jgi:predicted MFS family arabinose efflux permease